MAEQQAWGHNFRQTALKVLAVPAVGRKMIGIVPLYHVEMRVLKKQSHIASLRNLASNLLHSVYCPPFIWAFVTLLCKSQSLLVNGKEIRFILIIVFSLEMGKTFLLLYFCLAETRKDIMEMCWHRRTGAKTDQERVSGRHKEAHADISSKSALLWPPQR